MLMAVPVVIEVRAIHETDICSTSGKCNFDDFSGRPLAKIVVNELHLERSLRLMP